MLEAALNTVSIGYEGANKYKVRVAHKSIVAARHCWVSPTLSRTRLAQVRDPAGRPMLLLLDYMFFEDEGACQFQPWRCVCKFKCCDCYCLGCIFPCSCNCPAKEPEEGAGAPFAVDVVELIEAPAAEVIARAQ